MKSAVKTLTMALSALLLAGSNCPSPSDRGDAEPPPTRGPDPGDTNPENPPSNDPPAPQDPSDDDADDDPSDVPVETGCLPTWSGFEICDGVDNDCDGQLDESCGPIALGDDLAPFAPMPIDAGGPDPRRPGVSVAATASGELAVLTFGRRVVFVQADGELRRASVPAVDTPSDLETPRPAQVGLVQGSDPLQLVARGQWETPIADRATGRIEQGTTFYAVDESDGSRGEALTRLDDLFVDEAIYGPLGELHVMADDPEDIGRPDDRLLWLDVFGRNLELAPRNAVRNLTIDPSGVAYVCQVAPPRSLLVDSDGDFEAAASLSACPDSWGFTADGHWVAMVSEPSEPARVVALPSRGGGWMDVVELPLDHRLLWVDAHPSRDRVWFGVRNGDGDSHVYVLDAAVER